jgi:hypothetical protein
MRYFFIPAIKLSTKEQELLIEMHIDFCARLRALDHWGETAADATDATLEIEKEMVRSVFENEVAPIVVPVTAERLRKLRELVH